MSWVDVENKLSRIERISRSGKKVENLAYLLNKDMLRQCYKELKPDKAAGIDKVTKKQYGMNLDQNLTRLVSKLKGGTYFPRPSRRIYIPRPGTNKKRPLGISCFEDKIVERALNKILVAVYEPRFLDCSYGFRPKRNCHQAISKVLKSINGLTSYVVEADIRNCFGSFNHDILIEALELSIADRRFIEIIRRGLKAGHLEDNIYIDDLTGTAQGSGCSPTLANVYMHHVLDQWFKVKVSSRYYRGRKFNQKKARGAKGRSKPETFDFLGFTFYCSTSWKDPGKFCPKVKSIGKRMSRKIKQITSWIKYNRYLPVRNIVAHLHDVLRGYFNYYAVTCNSRCVKNFRYEVVKSLFKWLNRRSQRRSYTWKGFNQMLRTHKLDDAHIRVKIYELCV